ncbi:MAG: hypothetical protein ACI85O_001744 [Saprospiraceae bacterium]|jgi:hypothetical protein
MILRLLAALWYTIIPFGILSAIGALAYFTFEGLTGILVGLLFISLACLSGFYVFKTVMQVGVMKFMSTNSASSDLDNLEATRSDSFQTIEIEKLVESFEREPTHFHGGNVKIWGDWQGRDLENINEITTIEYEDESSILTITFKNGNKLLLTNPQWIIAGKTYLKNVRSEKVEWQWERVLEDTKFTTYTRKEKKIETNSNMKWSSLRTFVSIGEPALMISYKYDFSNRNDVILNSLIEES